MNQLTVVVVRVGMEPRVEQLDRGLEAWQAIVGGWIEQVSSPLVRGVDLICNEEGKLSGLPANLHMGWDVIVGNCFFTAADYEGEAVSLTPEQAEQTIKALEGRLIGIRRPYGSETDSSNRRPG